MAPIKEWFVEKWKHSRGERVPQGLASPPSIRERSPIRWGKLILITGASSDIAAHIIHEFLENDYSVRGVVESVQTGDRLRQEYAKYGHRFSFVVIHYISNPYAFDDAARDVDGVIHTWSPAIRPPRNNEKDILVPAALITMYLLQSVARYSPSVRRVVILSSLSAVVDPSGKNSRPGYMYTEADWVVMTYGDGVNGTDSRALSLAYKLMEETALRVVNDHRCKFRVTALCPSMILGPDPHRVHSSKNLSRFSRDINRLSDGSLLSHPIPQVPFHAFVDARDVAIAHRLAFESKLTGNKRYILTSCAYSNDMICAIIRAEYPDDLNKCVPVPQPGHTPNVYEVSNERSRRELGMTYRSLRRTVKDTVDDLLRMRRNEQKYHENVVQRLPTINANLEPLQTLEEVESLEEEGSAAKRVHFASPGTIVTSEEVENPEEEGSPMPVPQHEYRFRPHAEPTMVPFAQPAITTDQQPLEHPVEIENLAEEGPPVPAKPYRYRLRSWAARMRSALPGIKKGPKKEGSRAARVRSMLQAFDENPQEEGSIIIGLDDLASPDSSTNQEPLANPDTAMSSGWL